MNLPDWRDITLEAGVLREAVSDGGRVVLWLAGERDGAFQHWERVGSVPRAEVSAEQGLCSVTATSVPARQRIKGVVGKLLGRLHASKTSRALILPGGELAEPCGERAAGLLLVWAEDNGEPLDEARIKSRWPEAQQCRRLGPNLLLVDGVAARAAPAASVGAPGAAPARRTRPRGSRPNRCWPPRARAATASRKSRR